MQITVFTYDEMQTIKADKGVYYREDEAHRVPKFYVVDALGSYVFLHTRNRQKAQEYVDKEYSGRYSVRTWVQDAENGSLSCKATDTRKSQAGFRNSNYGIPRGLR